MAHTQNNNTLTGALLLGAGLVLSGIVMTKVWGKPKTKVEKVVKFGGTGLIFKDSVEVLSFQDPKIQGIVLHVSFIKRHFVDRISKPEKFFDDPSTSSTAVSETGPIKFDDSIDLTPAGEEVFSEHKNLLFKFLRIRRIYDAAHNTLVYIGYSTRVKVEDEPAGSDGRFKTSIATIPLKALKPPTMMGSNAMPA
eukprot:GILJ01014321.1.p1 GENE.GILJ01014321.1~~GILJ01014321.1.p1  ORF type:complete len:194 (-),score=27.54 GILJ01014321.1:153-734(-)